MSTPSDPLILVTGATGKVGRAFITRLLADKARGHWRVRAFCHQRALPPDARVESVFGAIQDRAAVQRALEGVTHVLHLATSKETPDDAMDVSVKGLFWLLEGCRASPSFRQFVLIGGDAAVGHFHYPHPVPVVETQPPTAYPGCYALSKVLEETMLQQVIVQYDLNACCLRAPWIMEKDDLRAHLSFGEDVFGAPRWCDLVGPEAAAAHLASGAVPVLLDANGAGLLRNFVHVDDLVSAILAALDQPRARGQLMNVAMDEPVDYVRLGEHLARTRGCPLVRIRDRYHSTWLDNSKAKFLLGWRPAYDLERLVESAWSWQRASDDPRRIWYPG
ncbi:MAG: NAD(P)-dependent oxidoreductase [Piscinibacter sp.]|uniref:NAD-dependent epimerase/dehydratase family protein n=1 Tax=Piscinibacter sp. TaxID=1903157 RepID=UPI002589DD96|nr:NAD(P)-dependent oxidoreductase [Piscinibacter sp.]MCW5666767.1 NAD(P)-dependent oxidoreductase [Piscinibacter sp.]